MSRRSARSIAEKHLELRDNLFGDVKPFIWDRLAHDGFATIPKTMPQVMNIMDDMTKGAPVSSTYLALWCATWDNAFVVINKPRELAHAAGFGGQRGEHTWGTRMKKLQELKFVEIKPGKTGPLSYAVIYNPHFVIRYHHAQKTPGLTEGRYSALIESALDLGAKDMLPSTPIPPGVFGGLAAA